MRRNLVLPMLCLLGALALPCLSPPAQAAEKYLGTLFVTDAGAVHNYYPTDGGSFGIPGLTYLTVQPSAAAYVCVNELATTGTPTCSSTKGVRVEQNQAFPTSCPVSRQLRMEDGGYVTGCAIAVMPVSGASVTVPVWSRQADGARPEF